MNLLFAIKRLENAPGGAERVLVDIANGLARRGHRVSVMTFDPVGKQPFYRLDPSVDWIPLGIGRADRPSNLAETLRRMVAMRRLVLRTRPDVVVGFMHSMFTPLGLALIGTGVPVVASEHIVLSHYWQHPLQLILLQLTPYVTKRITTVSERVKEGFTGNLRRHMTVISNPIGLDIKEASDVAGSVAGPKTILTIGRLTKQKDQKTLLQAFARLAPEFPDWNLRIVGEGELFASLEREIASLGLQGRAVLAGTTLNIGEEYARAQLFVLPSLYESFGLAAAEALAHGLPAVAFADCEGVSELITDGVNGVLVRGEARTQALAKALGRLMGSPELRKSLGAAGPAAMVEFSKEKICDKWEAFLRICLERDPDFSGISSSTVHSAGRRKSAVIYYPGFLSRVGGAFFHARNMDVELRKLGWDVNVITLDNLPAWCRYGPHLVQVLANTVYLPFGFMYKSRLIKRLFRRFFDIDADLRIFEDIYIAWNSDIPTVTMLHAVWSDNLQAYSVDPARERELRNREAAIANSLRHPLITVSSPYLEFLESVHFHGQLTKKIDVVELGRDQTAFRNAVRSERSKKALVYAGVLEPRKNLHFLLELFEKLFAADSAYTLTIIGDGPDRRALSRFSESRGLPVVFLGRMNYDDVVSELFRHSIYVHTSVKESFSYSLLEAKLAGLRTCAYGGLQVPAEFIDLAFESFSVEAWRDGILNLGSGFQAPFDGVRFSAERMTLSTLRLVGLEPADVAGQAKQ